MNDRFNTIIIDPGHGGVDFGFDNGVNYEKDFNLELGKYIYNKLYGLGFPVYITRIDDDTISNYDRFELLNQITDDNNGGSLVFSIQVDDENKDGLSFIHSINRIENTNNELYDKLRRIGEVKVKTLPNDDKKDFYAIQRLAPNGSDAIVVEFGYNILNDSKSVHEDVGDKIVNEIINYFGTKVFNNNYDKYIVQKSDTLFNISNRYNIGIDKLKKINNLETNDLIVGQVLNVPKLNSTIYTVKRGDSLYSIAKKFNITVDKIKNVNNLTSNKLIINQKILIPNQ